MITTATTTTTTPTTTTVRADFLTPIHKALRRSLFETAMALGRTDFSVADEVAAAERAVAVCLDHLRDHAAHEDRHVLPLLAELAPGVAAFVADEHPELERASIEVESLWPRLASRTGAERVALGAELARRFNKLVAAQLAHMDREEREALRALQEHFDDAALGQLSARIAADIEPARLAAFGELMFPALNRTEREIMQRPVPPAAAHSSPAS
jgi:hypothetical protein